MNFRQAISLTKKWQSSGKKIVLVTGVFDLLHIEHIRFLKKAKATADKLIVGLEIDQRVRKIKGSHRPINNQQIRLEQLNSLKSVDLAFLLPEKFNTQTDWENLINRLHPDIYAVSSHTSYLDNKRHICQKFNCQLKVVHSHNPHISTTKILSRLKPPSS